MRLESTPSEKRYWHNYYKNIPVMFFTASFLFKVSKHLLPHNSKNSKSFHHLRHLHWKWQKSYQKKKKKIKAERDSINVTATYPKLFHSLPCCRHIFQVICRILMLTNVYCFHFFWQGLRVFCFSPPPFAWGLWMLTLCDLKDESPEGKHIL